MRGTRPQCQQWGGLARWSEALGDKHRCDRPRRSQQQLHLQPVAAASAAAQDEGVFFGVAVTPWKLIGYLGILLFAGRWVVQLIATRARGRPVIPRSFWIMSVSGSALLLAYFIWGKNDSVGVLSNLFPMGVALYNLALDLRAAREDRLAHPLPGHAAGH